MALVSRLSTALVRENEQTLVANGSHTLNTEYLKSWLTVLKVSDCYSAGPIKRSSTPNILTVNNFYSIS